jgi:hypothetical protein
MKQVWGVAADAGFYYGVTNPHEETEGGTTMSDDTRMACGLSDAELRKREATLLATSSPRLTPKRDT